MVGRKNTLILIYLLCGLIQPQLYGNNVNVTKGSSSKKTYFWSNWNTTKKIVVGSITTLLLISAVSVGAVAIWKKKSSPNGNPPPPPQPTVQPPYIPPVTIAQPPVQQPAPAMQPSIQVAPPPITVFQAQQQPPPPVIILPIQAVIPATFQEQFEDAILSNASPEAVARIIIESNEAGTPINLNALLFNGQTAAQYAADMGNYALMEFLNTQQIQSRPSRPKRQYPATNVSSSNQNSNDRETFENLVIAGDVSGVDNYLSAFNVDLDIPMQVEGGNKQTPLDYAEQNHAKELIQILHKHGAGAQERFEEAVSNHEFFKAKELLNSPNNKIDFMNKKMKDSNLSALEFAVSKKNHALIDLFTQKIAQTDPQKAFDFAVIYQETDTVNAILDDYGAKISINKQFNEYTPLAFALQANNINLATVLLKHGADVEAFSFGTTPLSLLINHQGEVNLNAVKLLLQYHADPLKLDSRGGNAIGYATMWHSNNKELLKILKGG